MTKKPLVDKFKIEQNARTALLDELVADASRRKTMSRESKNYAWAAIWMTVGGWLKEKI